MLKKIGTDARIELEKIVEKKGKIMTLLKGLLLLFLILCAFITCLNKRILVSIVIFMSYSLVMSVVWAILESPDLAITEAAVGAGVTSILFFLTLKKIHLMEKEVDQEEKTKQ